MLSELDDQTCYKVAETGGAFASFVDALYCGNPKQPPISEANVESLVELHKYDVSDIAAHCDLFISGLNLGLSNLPRLCTLAATKLPHGISTSHCRAYVAKADNFMKLEK